MVEEADVDVMIHWFYLTIFLFFRISSAQSDHLTLELASVVSWMNSSCCVCVCAHCIFCVWEGKRDLVSVSKGPINNCSSCSKWLNILANPTYWSNLIWIIQINACQWREVPRPSIEPYKYTWSKCVLWIMLTLWDFYAKDIRLVKPISYSTFDS